MRKENSDEMAHFYEAALEWKKEEKKLSDYNELEIDGNFYIIWTDREEEIMEDE